MNEMNRDCCKPTYLRMNTVKYFEGERNMFKKVYYSINTFENVADLYYVIFWVICDFYKIYYTHT